MARLPLTDEQKTAICSGHPRLFIEAAPGSGKTTVAAERFGVLRFGRVAAPEGTMTAVSFTRSATSELRRRVRMRWGTSSLAWPHNVTTIDTLDCKIVQFLLRRQVIHWPGGHEALEVLDDWRGHRGYRWLIAGSNRRVATINNVGTVTSFGMAVREPQLGFGRCSTRTNSTST
ncbi:MAG: UvrD-helicase domain-containing protein [Actinobacteria bacterium]|nr:UvrD-helicase domain-containing protein [Actinomycetota bacterium]